MPFVGIIDSVKNNQLWSKSIISLASISDHIKFVITSEGLALSSVNSPRTSHAEIKFKTSFFHEYSLNYDDIVSDGYEKTQDSESYSFLVNSKHLSTLFRNLDANDLDYICFKIYWEDHPSNHMKYKLLIEIKTKKLIIKKYRTNYQPSVRNPVQISSIYKQYILNEPDPKDQGDNRINYIMIEQQMPKQFLDMIPTSTEDFKIDIKNEKISLSGYTKQILKDREYLKQPMSLTITLNLDELMNSNLTTLTQDQEPIRKCINFRLKDFKNFMSLISSFNTSSNNSDENGYINLNKNEGDEYFEIYFRNPGDPVLFELNNHPHVLVSYIQITSQDMSDGSSKDVTLQLRPDIVEKAKPSDKVSKPPHSKKKSLVDVPQPRKPLSFIKKYSETKKAQSNLSSQSKPLNREFSPPETRNSGVDFDTDSSDSRNDSSRHIKWSKLPDDNIHDAQTDYSDSDDKEKGNEYESQEDGDELVFGPTQVNNKPRSILDG